MKHTILILGLALCAPLAINAQTNTMTSTSSTMSTTSTKMMKKTEYHGMVKSVDTAGNTITVTNKKGDMTLMVTASTKIMQDKKPATLADITMGEKVSGSYMKDATGAMMAASIHGKSMPAAMAPAAATSTTSSSTTTTSTNMAPSTP